jgi:hypothetical protein
MGVMIKIINNSLCFNFFSTLVEINHLVSWVSDFFLFVHWNIIEANF